MRYDYVAPFAGAWIETEIHVKHVISGTVAPFAGAWIETRCLCIPAHPRGVAPFAGAWIETVSSIELHKTLYCRSLRGSVD